MLEWHEKKINDIETNPIDCWWAVGSSKNINRRFYRIVPYEKVDSFGMENGTGKYYALFEYLDHDFLNLSDHFEVDGIKSPYMKFGDWLLLKTEAPVAIYESLVEAAQRAEYQLKVIDNLISEYFSKNDEKLIDK